MRRRLQIREVHDLEFLGWILPIFLVLLLAWASRAAALPDNRAWEQVSPVNKGGGEVPHLNQLSGGGIMQSSLDGSAVTYVSLVAFPGSNGEVPQGAPFGNQYLAKRGALGWSTENITAPTQSQEYGVSGAGGPYKAFSETLSSSLLYLGEVPLSPGEPEGYRDYHVRDNQTGTYQSLLSGFPREAGETIMPVGKFNIELEAVTPDLKHIVIGSEAVLTRSHIQPKQRKFV